jgi:hypothetical protein
MCDIVDVLLRTARSTQAAMQESYPSAEAGAAPPDSLSASAADPPPPAWASRAKRSAPEKVKRYAPPEPPEPIKRPSKKRKSDVELPDAKDVKPTPDAEVGRDLIERSDGSACKDAAAAVVAAAVVAAPSQLRVQLPASAVPGQHCKASYQREGKQCTVSFEVPAF